MTSTTPVARRPHTRRSDPKAQRLRSDLDNLLISCGLLVSDDDYDYYSDSSELPPPLPPRRARYYEDDLAELPPPPPLPPRRARYYEDIFEIFDFELPRQVVIDDYDDDHALTDEEHYELDEAVLRIMVL